MNMKVLHRTDPSCTHFNVQCSMFNGKCGQACDCGVWCCERRVEEQQGQRLCDIEGWVTMGQGVDVVESSRAAGM